MSTSRDVAPRTDGVVVKFGRREESEIFHSFDHQINTRRGTMTTKTKNITFMSGGTSRASSTRGLLAVAVCGLFISLTVPSARACQPAGGCDGFGIGVAPHIVQRPDFRDWINQNADQNCDGQINFIDSLPFDEVNDADCFFWVHL